MNADNQLLVIFGASGDLTKRKLMPSLCELYARGLMPEKFAVLGASRTGFTDEQFREEQRKDILATDKGRQYDEKTLEGFLDRVYYLGFDSTNPKQYGKLKTRIDSLMAEIGNPDKIVYYLSTPPVMYELIPSALASVGLNRAETKKGWRRIIVEKPFGTDLDSAVKLGDHLRSIFHEDEIYRIDHYLGKETVQNILVLRFSNGIFEPLWNRNYIDSVEIMASETLGVENRGNYYDHAGALRDMIQNHLMQLMGFVAMEPPAVFDPEPIRDEIAKVFRSIHHYPAPAIPRNVIRAQYTASTVDGRTIPGYLEEKNVAPDSQTETFVALKLHIDNWRWGGVPFYLYTGKRLHERKSEITINFKSTPTRLFAGQCSGPSCNKLILRIQPDESISLHFGLKMPGAGFTVKQVSMDFSYGSLSSAYLPEAYERLLMDAMLGDSTLYARRDALEASWRFIDPILQYWKTHPKTPMYSYPALSDGPVEMEDLWMEDEPELQVIPCGSDLKK